ADSRSRGERRHGLLGILIGHGGVHLGVLQFSYQLLHLRAIRAQRLGLEDLPFVLIVLTELDGLPLGLQFDARQLVGIERKQALVAQVFGGFVEARFRSARYAEYSRIVLELDERAAAGRSVIADEQVFRLAILLGYDHFDGRRSQPILGEIRGFVLDEPIGGQRRKRGHYRAHRVLIGRERLRLLDLPFARIRLLHDSRVAAGFLQTNNLELVIGNCEDFRWRILGGRLLFRLLVLARPVATPTEASQNNYGDQ